MELSGEAPEEWRAKSKAGSKKQRGIQCTMMMATRLRGLSMRLQGLTKVAHEEVVQVLLVVDGLFSLVRFGK